MNKTQGTGAKPAIQSSRPVQTATQKPKGETVIGQVSRVSGAGMRQPSLQGRIYGDPATRRSAGHG